MHYCLQCWLQHIGTIMLQYSSAHSTQHDKGRLPWQTLTDCKGVSVRQSISREEQCCISSVGSEQVGESLALVREIHSYANSLCCRQSQSKGNSQGQFEERSLSECTGYRSSSDWQGDNQERGLERFWAGECHAQHQTQSQIVSSLIMGPFMRRVRVHAFVCWWW